MQWWDSMTTIKLRKATQADRERVLQVERESTPGLQYLPFVYEQFLANERGEFSVAECDGDVVACAKLTVLPDNSAWLETIRVAPSHQGLGIGKRFYENYFAIAAREGVTTLRMYTGLRNVVSKGLAERFGFSLAATFYEMKRDVEAIGLSGNGFAAVTDPAWAVAQVLDDSAEFRTFLTMNRTFYELSPALIRDMVQRRCVYANDDGDVVIAGARFMPHAMLHIGLFAGDAIRCLQFANQLAAERGIPQQSCIFPVAQASTKQTLLENGFQPSKSKLIVMQRTIDY